MAPDGYVQCYGRKACFGTTIESGLGVYSYGWFGVKQGSITNTPLVYAFGYNSVASTTIDSDGLDNMVVKGYGYRALYHSEIYCRSGTNCTIQCDGKLIKIYIQISFVYIILYI